MDLLRLIAFDKDDIEVVSTHLQDAIVLASDILWLPKEKRLVIACNRFDWEAAQCADPECRRRRAALRFERVNAFQARKLKPSDKERVLELLAVEFAEADPPAGVVTLTFSGGAALRLEVECLECELADLGPSWTARARPGHPDDPQPIPG
jgi:Protein of unknown function (DUF2948)